MENSNFIQSLIKIGAIKLNIDEPYTWSSGWKSPIYCDNRLTLSYIGIRNFIKTELSYLANINYPSADIIAGVATAGIPHAAFLADELSLPMIYVRSEAKKHGLGNQIEGHIDSKQKALIVEDLISTGKSSIKVAEALKNEGVEVSGIVGIFSYGFPDADEAFKKAKLTYHTIATWEDLIAGLEKSDLIGDKKRKILEEWRESPSTWRQ